MRKIIILITMVFIYQTGSAQELDKCNDIIKITIEAINSNSLEELKPHLASDFKIAGQTGEIAKMVITQLVSQLGETVKSQKVKSTTEENNILTIVTAFEYKKMGVKDATFVFNSDNELQELTLFKMEVKTMNAKTTIEKNTKDTIEIPFKMAGDLILVDVLLNGEKRNFLFDSGSPKLLLNSKYIAKSGTKDKKTITSAKGAGGSISGMNIEKIESIDFAGIKLNNQDVLTIDISHLEKELGTEIYGLIGYGIISDYDVLLDYDKKEITLINPNYYSEYKNNVLNNKELTIVPFDLKSHIPVIKTTIDSKEYSFGIDTGAESNLMDDDLFSKLKGCLSNVSTDTLTGADKNKKEVISGYIKQMSIGGNKFKKLNTLFNDMSHLNDGYGMNIDGLIGYEVLSKQQTLISYKRKEMVFIE